VSRIRGIAAWRGPNTEFPLSIWYWFLNFHLQLKVNGSSFLILMIVRKSLISPMLYLACGSSRVHWRMTNLNLTWDDGTSIVGPIRFVPESTSFIYIFLEQSLNICVSWSFLETTSEKCLEVFRKSTIRWTLMATTASESVVTVHPSSLRWAVTEKKLLLLSVLLRL
jgi:hypothetical protein